MFARIREFVLGRNTMQFTFIILVIIYGLLMEMTGWQDLYLFAALRDPQPAFWWPVRSRVVMVALIVFILFLFLLSRTQWRERIKGWTESLFVIAVLGMFGAVAWDTTTGVAIYPDRAESTLLTFTGYQKETLYYRDVRSVTLGCRVVETRGSEQAQVFYKLHGDLGAVIDLEQGLAKRAPDATWLTAVHTADSAIPGITVRRQLEPKPDSINQYKACVEKFRNLQADNDKALVAQVFERPEMTGLMN